MASKNSQRSEKVVLSVHLALAAFGAWFAACDGVIVAQRALPADVPGAPGRVASPPEAPTLPETPPPPRPDNITENVFSCMQPARPLISSEMKRLTQRELVLVLSDVFGSTVVDAVSAQIALYPKDVLTDPAETYVKEHTRDHVKAAFYLADALGVALSADRSALQPYGGACISAQVPTQNCVKTLIQRLGARVFRRPLTTGSAGAEVEQLLATYSGESQPNGLRLLISKMMLAPDFWFHLEARGVAEPQQVRLTPYEVASRISFGVTGSSPDSELIAAAQRGQLATREQVRQHVQRLMQTERGKQQVLDFFSSWLLLQNTPELSQLPQFLSGTDSEGLAEEMVQELKHFIEHIVFEKRGTFSDLFMNRSLFAKTERLADIYKTTRWAEGQLPTSSSGPYRGILLRGKLFLAEGENSSPILRGVFMRNRMLCETIHTPPNDVIEQRMAEDPDRTMVSNRMRTEFITQALQCSGCHRQINPIGFVFENFDNLGRWRTVEKVYSEAGAVVAQHPIRTNVIIEGVSKMPLATESPVELNAAMSKSEVASACLSRRVFRHLNLRDETDGVADNCRLHDMHDTLRTSTLFDFFVESIANDGIFAKPM